MRAPFSSVPVTPMYVVRRPNRAQAPSAVATCPPQEITSRVIGSFARGPSGAGAAGSSTT